MANLKLRGELTSAFKMHGLQLRQEAVKYGLAVVSQVGRWDWLHVSKIKRYPFEFEEVIIVLVWLSGTRSTT